MPKAPVAEGLTSKYVRQSRGQQELSTWQQHVWRHQQQLRQRAVLLTVLLCVGAVPVLAWLCGAAQYPGCLGTAACGS